ncbi:MAG: hypothetical protein WCI72_02235 [archaeon]
MAKPKKQTEDMRRGMAYQKGMDTAVKYCSGELPLLLTDEELGCLEITLTEMEDQGTAEVTYFGTADVSGSDITDVRVYDYIKKLITVYSHPRVITHGIKTMEQMGLLDFSKAGDQYVSPYEGQMRKVNYRPKRKR